MDVTLDDDSYNPEDGTGAVAVEFVAPGITSPAPAIIEPVLDIALPENPHIYFADVIQRGYLVLDVRPEKVQSDWYYIEGLDQDQRAEIPGPSFAVQDGAAHVMEMSGPESPSSEPPPLAT